MAKKYALLAEKRDRAGKGVARALRREHRVPAVVYGDGKEPVLISVLEKELTKEYLRGYMQTHLCDLDAGGQKILCLARDVQLHPVTDRVEHVDFLRVSAKTKINVDVPVHFINQDAAPGIKAGGVLNIVSHTMELLCSATEIPEFVEVDMTGVEIGDALRMDRVKLPSGVEAVDDDPDHTLATLIAPKTSTADDAADEAAASAASAASAATAAAAAGGIAAPAADKKPADKKPADKK